MSAMNLRRPLALSIVYLGTERVCAGVVNCASVSLTDQAFAKDKPKDGPTLQMEVNAPPELRRRWNPTTNASGAGWATAEALFVSSGPKWTSKTVPRLARTSAMHFSWREMQP